jgi:glutamyl-Q tRNA(Asp) synthetase
VRFEDLDTPRNRAGACDTILRQLDELGLHANGIIIRQSSRLYAYREVIKQLQALGRTFGCGCSRADLSDGIYPGTCRNGLPPGKRARAVRLRVNHEQIDFSDAIQGLFSQNLSTEVGDFVIRRADNIIAYHLAVVVDDAWQEVTEVVRGADLLDSTPRQIYLQRLLGLRTPSYVHLPIAVDRDGRKISKQDGAPAVDSVNPGVALWEALSFLGQAPALTLRKSTPAEILEWAIHHWQIERVPRQRQIAVT